LPDRAIRPICPVAAAKVIPAWPRLSAPSPIWIFQNLKSLAPRLPTTRSPQPPSPPISTSGTFRVIAVFYRVQCVFPGSLRGDQRAGRWLRRMTSACTAGSWGNIQNAAAKTGRASSERGYRQNGHKAVALGRQPISMFLFFNNLTSLIIYKQVSNICLSPYRRAPRSDGRAFCSLVYGQTTVVEGNLPRQAELEMISRHWFCYFPRAPAVIFYKSE